MLGWPQYFCSLLLTTTRTLLHCSHSVTTLTQRISLHVFMWEITHIVEFTVYTLAIKFISCSHYYSVLWWCQEFCCSFIFCSLLWRMQTIRLPAMQAVPVLEQTTPLTWAKLNFQAVYKILIIVNSVTRLLPAVQWNAQLYSVWLVHVHVLFCMQLD